MKVVTLLKIVFYRLNVVVCTGLWKPMPTTVTDAGSTTVLLMVLFVCVRTRMLLPGVRLVIRPNMMKTVAFSTNTWWCLTWLDSILKATSSVVKISEQTDAIYSMSAWLTFRLAMTAGTRMPMTSFLSMTRDIFRSRVIRVTYGCPLMVVLLSFGDATVVGQWECVVLLGCSSYGALTVDVCCLWVRTD